MRIIYGTKAQDHTNNLFINLNVKFFYYIEYKTAITRRNTIYFRKKHSETFSFERQMLSCYKTEIIFVNVCSYHTEGYGYVYDYSWSQIVE